MRKMFDLQNLDPPPTRGGWAYIYTYTKPRILVFLLIDLRVKGVQPTTYKPRVSGRKEPHSHKYYQQRPWRHGYLPNPVSIGRYSNDREVLTMAPNIAGGAVANYARRHMAYGWSATRNDVGRRNGAYLQSPHAGDILAISTVPLPVVPTNDRALHKLALASLQHLHYCVDTGLFIS